MPFPPSFPSIPQPPLLTDSRLLGLLRTILAPCVRPVRNATQIQRTTHQLVPHTGTILGTSTTHKHDTVLLDVVALAGDVRRDGLARSQAHTCSFSFSRVGLLGSCNTDFDADAFALGVLVVGQGGGDGMASSAIFTAALMLHVSIAVRRWNGSAASLP